MASPTNYPNGISVTTRFPGSNVEGDVSNLAGTSLFTYRTAVIRCDSQGQETGFTFPETCIVTNFYLNVIEIDDGRTANVGRDGDSDAFMDGVSLSNAGLLPISVDSSRVTAGVAMRETQIITAPELAVDIEVLTLANNVDSGGINLEYTSSSDSAVFDIIVEYIEVTSA